MTQIINDSAIIMPNSTM